MKELFEATSHNLIGYFPKHETKNLELLKNLAKARKNSALFIEVTLVDDSIQDQDYIKATFKEGHGMYLWINDSHGPKRLIKYPYEYEDSSSLITYIEVESLPKVLLYKPADFSQVFAGVLKVLYSHPGAIYSVRGHIRRLPGGH